MNIYHIHISGGNHFIEAYKDGWISVHSGSQDIGRKVAEYYQNLAEKRILEDNISVNRDLCYLMGSDMEDYLYDVSVMQIFANDNRMAILKAITEAMDGKILEHINSIHNYINVGEMILRKGAISAQKGQILVIPLNMRDGLLLCKGKGNAEWNNSAPHGAGRLYSRSEAKSRFTVEKYAEQMKGIYSSCINKHTLDEAPFAYKDYKEIMDCVEPTVEILDRFLPIFNFKAK